MSEIDRRKFNALLAGAGLASAASGFGPRKVEPEILRFEPSEGIPNNGRLPVLLYRDVFGVQTSDPADYEALFERNGWPPQWRNGVYSFHHYHATAHEVLAFAVGHARLLLGGPGGKEVTVSSGDVALLPAGTGHRRLEASNDFLVIGAYPPGQHPDIQRGAVTPELERKIAAVAIPKTDPVLGKAGPYLKHWLGEEKK